MKNSVLRIFKYAAALFSAAMISTGVACADNDRPIAFEKLPANARDFVKKYFPDEKVSFAKEERDFMELTYEVVLVNGTRIDFDKKGDWKDVDCKYSVLNEELIPAKIREYVSANYPGTSYVKIERSKRDYEVKITNGLELTFDLDFNIIDIDD